jgi:C1A family cysteine protease
MIPDSVDMREFIKLIPAQANIGSCTACAALLAAELIMERTGKSYTFSRLFLYYTTRQMSGRVNQEGANLGDTFAALASHGVPEEYMWPYLYMHRNTEPPLQTLDAAAFFKIRSYTRISIDVNTMKTCLANGQPITVGINTGRQFWKLVGLLNTQLYKPVNDTDNRQYKGHAMTIVGYDNQLGSGSFIFANSLGPTWGDHGYGALPYECVADIGEAFIINNFAGISGERKKS